MAWANYGTRSVDGRLKSAFFAIFPSVCLTGIYSTNAWASDIPIDYNDIETIEVAGLAVVGKDNTTGTVDLITVQPTTLTHAFVLPDVIATTPSSNIRTNSRGETLVSIRGSGDRQLAGFFDGASVNVPWDNRIDLNLLPLSGVSLISVSSGPSAVSYGGGTAGGVIEIQPMTDQAPAVAIEVGSGQQRRVDASFGLENNAIDLVLAGGHWQRDGIVAERGTRSVFAASGDGLITNTDRKQSNFLARLSHDYDGSSGLAASILYNTADYGVAPEQGPNFSSDDARFWRLPDNTYLLATLNGHFGITENISSDIAIWKQTFNQDIQSFSDDTYSVIEDTQEDRNDTYGVRTVLAYADGAQRLTINGSALWSRHDQKELKLLTNFTSEATFTQQTYGLGFDYSREINSNLSTVLGVGYDVFDPRRTAGREGTGRFSGLNVVAEINYRASNTWLWRASAGRRVRLPTMRELFGDAIGRFMLNAELKPEETLQFEAAASYQTEAMSVQIVSFLSVADNTLDQRRVIVGESTLRQRFNRNGSRTFGVEASGEMQLTDRLSVDGNATWNKHSVQREIVDNSTRRLYLSDRPNWLARANVAYQLGQHTTFGLNVVYRGEARSQDGEGNFQQINAATQVGLALTHQLFGVTDSFGVALYVRADNVTDTFVEPQLGLPDQGRTLRFGLTASL
ncbi:TonB-dependent receptor [Kordiimonas aquimaris]|uniref:TonB-dependent receptor n=1 Tax=Kordiimonas aquimaris TaxID=707591 RepID=UPI0021CF8AE2|nr:TonB-dependent receptor [Kordiimonas aquimaris]